MNHNSHLSAIGVVESAIMGIAGTAPAYSTGPSDEGSQTLTYKITAIPTFITLFKADGTTAVTAGTTVTAIEYEVRVANGSRTHGAAMAWVAEGRLEALL